MTEETRQLLKDLADSVAEGRCDAKEGLHKAFVLGHAEGRAFQAEISYATLLGLGDNAGPGVVS